MRPRRRTQMLAAAVLMLTLTPGAPARAAAQRSGLRYTGHTGQSPGRRGVQRLADNRVELVTLPGVISRFTIPWVAPCLDAYHHLRDAPLIDRSELDDLPVRHGRFDVNSSYDMTTGDREVASVELNLTGRVRGAQAFGTLEVFAQILVDGSHLNDRCSQTLHWRATRR